MVVILLGMGYNKIRYKFLSFFISHYVDESQFKPVRKYSGSKLKVSWCTFNAKVQLLDEFTCLAVVSTVVVCF